MTKFFNHKPLWIIATLTFSLAIGGCASATKPEAMIVQTPDGVEYNTISETVHVITEGGMETSSVGASQISNADFQLAIVESIKKSRLFLDIAENTSEASYILYASIIDVEQPTMGFSMTVSIEVAWSLSRVEDKKPVWRSSHQSTYTASAGAAFAGVTRLRLATEGAAKENIEWALKSISQLETL